jgi:hypothetical protein
MKLEIKIEYLCTLAKFHEDIRKIYPSKNTGF